MMTPSAYWRVPNIPRSSKLDWPTIIIPEGEYEARVVDAEPKVGSTSGTPYIWIQLAVITPLLEHVSTSLFLAISGITLSRFPHTYTKFNIPFEPKSRKDLEPMLGQWYRVKVRHEEGPWGMQVRVELKEWLK